MLESEKLLRYRFRKTSENNLLAFDADLDFQTSLHLLLRDIEGEGSRKRRAQTTTKAAAKDEANPAGKHYEVYRGAPVEPRRADRIS